MDSIGMVSRQGDGKTEFLALPRGKPTGSVVVFHEVWGLVDQTRDVCRRLSKLGFAAVAPNLYRGKERTLTPDNIQKAMEGVWELSLEERRDISRVTRVLERKRVSAEVKKVVSTLYDPDFRDDLLERALSAVERAHSRFGDVATLGFCLGGGLSYKCAAKGGPLVSAVGFYGEPPPRDEAERISVPVLAIFANHDELINWKVSEFVDVMLLKGKDLTLKTFPGTKHGFFNQSRRAVYDREAAADAWELTRWFLERR
jgi:carboxymethylenebutenolidase